MTLQTSARLSFGLGVLSLVAVVVSHLALTDIWHGEADTTLEWRVLRVCFLIIVAFQVLALATLRRLLHGDEAGGGASLTEP